MTVRVLLVDDSIVTRKAIRRMLDAPDMEIVGEARDGEEALELCRRLDPDLVTLDIRMPGMDGLEVLDRIMEEMPRPVIMFSSLTTEGAEATVEALSRGAVDFIPKGQPHALGQLFDRREEVLERIRRVVLEGAVRPLEAPPSPARKVPAAKLPDRPPAVVAIGASTGGPSVVHAVLEGLPASFPACVLVAQHMPEAFTPAFARRLDERTALRVREVRDGDVIEAGLCLVGRGGHHMEVEVGGRLRVFVDLDDDPWFYVPSVDILMESAAAEYGSRTAGVLLTGMGSDGARGMRAIVDEGGYTIAQDEASSVIYGMPQAADRAGGVSVTLGIDRIGEELRRLGTIGDDG